MTWNETFFPAVDEKVKGDEFWDYDQQVDLEGFTSGRLYGILAKQSREVTAAIARQKDQVRFIIDINTISNKSITCQNVWTLKFQTIYFGRSSFALFVALRINLVRNVRAPC